jgi:cytochrome c-type biogenesis protein CcmH/NrfG
VPEALREPMLGAVAAVAESGEARGVAATLHAAADRLLREALRGPHTRGHALTLLAADALQTYACEAEAAPDAV